jgi:hypothetical protein
MVLFGVFAGAPPEPVTMGVVGFNDHARQTLREKDAYAKQSQCK